MLMLVVVADVDDSGGGDGRVPTVTMGANMAMSATLTTSATMAIATARTTMSATT